MSKRRKMIALLLAGSIFMADSGVSLSAAIREAETEAKLEERKGETETESEVEAKLEEHKGETETKEETKTKSEEKTEEETKTESEEKTEPETETESEEKTEEETETESEEETEPEAESEFANIAIATVSNYVNLREDPTTESEVVGKLYADSAAKVLETVTDEAGEAWYQVDSGSVENAYVKAEFVTVGDEELIRQVSTRYATVRTTTLFVRKEPGTDSPVIGMLPDGDNVTVLEEREDGWLNVSVEEGKGYISGAYTELWTDYTEAESKAEEEARLAREEAERQAAAKAAEKTQAKGAGKAQNVPQGSSKGQSVVNYASQFVGNPYVYGGSSLTHGADCSGFVMSVYAAFGVGLPHSSSALRNVGYGVSMDQIQPGDIVCYDGHVGIYAGNNTLLHASSPSSGIKYTSPITYRQILAIRRIF